MITRSRKFPDVPSMDQELDSIVKQTNDNIKTATSQTAATASGLFVAASSGGAVTRELKVKTVTLSDGTTLNVLVSD